jgi:hypothetical protein
MIETVLGKMEFNTGFKMQDSILFCGESKKITVKVKAYYEDDGITDKQSEALKKYSECRLQMNEKISDLAIGFDKDAKERFIPKTLLFGRNGECALLCDDITEPDEGIAICLFPNENVISQDDYL